MDAVWVNSIASGVPVIIRNACRRCGYKGPLTGAGLQQEHWASIGVKPPWPGTIHGSSVAQPVDRGQTTSAVQLAVLHDARRGEFASVTIVDSGQATAAAPLLDGYVMPLGQCDPSMPPISSGLKAVVADRMWIDTCKGCEASYRCGTCLDGKPHAMRFILASPYVDRIEADYQCDKCGYMIRKLMAREAKRDKE